MISLSSSGFFPLQLVRWFERLFYKPEPFGPLSAPVLLDRCALLVGGQMTHTLSVFHLCFPNMSWETVSSITCMSFTCVTFQSASSDTAELYYLFIWTRQEKWVCSRQNPPFCPSGLHLNAPSTEDNEFLSLASSCRILHTALLPTFSTGPKGSVPLISNACWAIWQNKILSWVNSKHNANYLFAQHASMS